MYYIYEWNSSFSQNLAEYFLNIITLQILTHISMIFLQEMFIINKQGFFEHSLNGLVYVSV